MKPFITKIEIDMNPDYNAWCALVPLDKDVEPFVLDCSEPFPYKIVSVPSIRLTEEERLERCALAIHDWINKHD